MNKKAILLINLGTPDHCDAQSVKRYLREFLLDPRVIDLPMIIRWPLVNLAIVPFRYQATTEAYQKIWQTTGSPLLTISQQLKNALAVELSQNYQVELGMRYGNPSIAAAWEKLKEAESLTVVPLFPQYSSAATGSTIETLMKSLSKEWNIPQIKIIKDFYYYPEFVHAFAEQIRMNLAGKKVDKILFSYHGLPERHIKKSHCQILCGPTHACPNIGQSNLYCYRAQCYATTELIAKKLNLTPDQYVVSFQSRLGRIPWIKPYTDLLLPELLKKEIKNIAIVSPSFVADCLETLEEINIRAREQWSKLGGKEFIFIPCVNATPLWVKALANLVSTP
ncbi:MAG: ferrochelatase [Gammaproteobacteria bacterium]|nr:ferrochelatase [Gammaproteobacteria bacterium]MCW5583089.1 ferrochelatase [Gammaproteobacteria bacterium]